MSNLRIKNKKLKRELELLRVMTVPAHEIVHYNCDVVTLRSSHMYDDNLYGYIPDDVIVKSSIRDLMDEIKSYVKIDSHRDRDTGKFVVNAELMVVK